jgi:hypothetical protein
VLPFQPTNGELVFNANWYWQDSYYVANGELPSYDLANLCLHWNAIGNTDVDLSFFMRNALDDEYLLPPTPSRTAWTFTPCLCRTAYASLGNILAVGHYQRET